jgi:poly-gamma-glutamate synthesis protein (capsule biosynthesis protein)
MYFPTLDAATGKLQKLELVPTRIRKFRVNYAGEEDRAWTLARLRRECKAFGVKVEAGERGAFLVR